MNDTSPAIEVMFFNMMMAKSGEERLRMGFEMYEMARKIVIASILKDNPVISEREMKVSLLNMFYGDDLSSEIKTEVCRENKRVIIDKLQFNVENAEIKILQ